MDLILNVTLDLWSFVMFLKLNEIFMNSDIKPAELHHRGSQSFTKL